MNFGSRFDHFAHNLFRHILFAMRNHSGFHLPAALQQSHNDCLAVSTLHSTITTHALPLRLVHESGLAADEGLIHFDRSAIAPQFGNASGLQGEAQAMQDEPCRLLSDPDGLGDFVGTDAVLAVDQHPERGEPFVQFDRGILKDGSQFYGELLVALFALPALLCRKVIVLFMAASRAFRAIRPAEAGYGVNADLFI